MSFLVLSKSKKQAVEYITKEIEVIENTNVNLINNPDIINNIDSTDDINVGLIREFINLVSNKPTHLKNKYLVLFNFNKANVNAQNAFLKTLEEGNTIVFLHAATEATLLNTTVSRLKKVKLEDILEVDEDLQNIIDRIITSCEIKEISNIAKKFDLLTVLENLEVYLQTNKPKNYEVTGKKLYLLKKRNFETNLNSEIQLTNIFIDLIN